MVLWNMSHTENSQILGGAVQNEATWAMLCPRCGQLCRSDTLELTEVKERKWGQSVGIDGTFNCGHVAFHRVYATAGGRNEPF